MADEHRRKFSLNENSFIAKYLSNPRLVILLLLLILIVGLNALFTIPRTLNPEIKIPIVLITTVLPGAGPGDVETLVTIPIEDSVRGIQRIDTIQSNSQESVSIINIQFQSGVDPDKALQDVQTRVNSATDLPEDAQDPQVQKLDFENQPVWVFNLTSTKDDGSLFRFAKDLQQKLKDLPEVDNVSISGLEQTEIQITIKQEAISAYGVNPILLTPAISNSLKSFPAGYVRAQDSVFSLTIDPEVASVEDIRKLRINLNGQNIALSEIAIISEHPKPDQNQSFLSYPICQEESPNLFQRIFGKKEVQCVSRVAPQRSVTFNIFKTSTTNIDTAVKVSEVVVEGEIHNNEGKFQVATLINTKELIDEQYFDLARDFTITIILVVLVLLIFLGARQALVAALSAPLSFLIAFSVMKATGISLNFLSLFSLLLSLGLLVDDTVVVISAITAYYRKYRLSPLQTGLLVWKDFLIPIFTTTITTVFAFLPLLIATGIIGEFIKSIPIVVSTTLFASFLVSLFVILPLMILLMKLEVPNRVKVLSRILVIVGLVGIFYLIIPKDNNLILLQILAFLVLVLVVNLVKDELLHSARTLWSRWQSSRKTIPSRVSKTLSSKQGRWSIKRIMDQGLISFAAIEKDYTKLIENIVTSRENRRRTLIIVGLFFIFSVLLIPLGFVKNEFFPKTDADLVYVSVEYPAGTYVAQTKKEALILLEELRNSRGVKFVTADIGQSFSADQGGTAGSTSNTVLFSLILKDKGEREVTSIDLAESLREKYSNYDKGEFIVQELSGGPPAGADIQIKILGDDLQQLDSYANKVIDFLKTQSGVTNIKKSIEPGTSKITFIPDQNALAQNNIGIDQIGLWLRSYSSGFSMSKVKLEGEDEKTDITFRLSSSSSSADSLTALQIPTVAGNLPITSLGRFELETNPTLITREEGERTISISAAVTQGVNSQEVNQKLEQFANTDLNLAGGYSWKTGGANEQNQESINSILQAMILSFLLIIVTMVIQFSSFRRALIVMLVIPLAAAGVFVIFALSQTPLSFPALIGILALFGIVVKNSILIVDRIVENEKIGMPLVKAIGEASASRLEPIALTTFATIMGLVPITFTDPLWRGLGGAIIAGLFFSGTIMLFFIPVVYYLWFRGKNN